MYYLNLIKGNIEYQEDLYVLFEKDTNIEKRVEEKYNPPGYQNKMDWGYSAAGDKTLIRINNLSTFKEILNEVFKWIKENAAGDCSIAVPYKFGEDSGVMWNDMYQYLSMIPMKYDLNINIIDETIPNIKKEAVKTYDKWQIAEKMEEKIEITPVVKEAFKPLKEKRVDKYKEALKHYQLTSKKHPRVMPFQKTDISLDELKDYVERINAVHQIDRNKDLLNHFNAKKISYEQIQEKFHSRTDSNTDGYLLVYIRNGLCFIPYTTYGSYDYIYKLADPRMMTDDDIHFIERLERNYEKEIEKLKQKKELTSFINEKQRLRKIMK